VRGPRRLRVLRAVIDVLAEEQDVTWVLHDHAPMLK
jgi:hypothetical protein